MKQIQQQLTIIYWVFITIPVLFAILMDTDLIETGILADIDQGGSQEFVYQAIAILYTLMAIPVALKSFKLAKVARRLQNAMPTTYRKLAVMRLVSLELALVIDFTGYYLYANSSFFHLGLIVLLAFIFVYPSMNRCLNETGNQKEEEAA